MIKRIRKFLPENIQKQIYNSLPYRLLERLKLKNHKINFSCELTTNCNARCIMCSRSAMLKHKSLELGEIKPEIIKKILEEIKNLHAQGKKIYFSPMGLGEPLLYSKLFVLLKKIKKISKDIEIVISTNGILLDKKTAEKLILLGIDEICISLNANNSEDYKKLMGVDAYEKVKENTRNLIILRNKSQRKLPSIFVQYLSSSNSHNFAKDISEFRKLMKYGDKCFIHNIANQAGFCPVETSIPIKENYPCTQPLWRIAVKLNGDIYPCDPCFYSGSKKINSLFLGNIKNSKIFDLSAGSKRAKIIEAMRKNNYSEFPECSKCNTYKLACNCFFKIPNFFRIKGYKWL